MMVRFFKHKHNRSKSKVLLITIGTDGFTVTELVLALAMMMMIITAMVSLLISLNGIYAVQNVAAGVQQETRAGINIMTRDIRMAGINPLKMNRIGILEASDNKIRFQNDTNGNGTIETGQGEDIAYLLNSSHQLIRQKDGNSRSNRSLVDNVSALKLKYVNRDNEETDLLDDIHTVEISLAVREPAGNNKFVSRTYSTRVICRNLSIQNSLHNKTTK
jgi:type IV pilus assembly protein PilW